MLPSLPIQQKLELTFSLPQTGFEFKKRRAFPILEGVVVAQENETLLLKVRHTLLPLSFLCLNNTTPNKAYWEAEKEAARKAEAKRNERVIKHWTRLIQGLRIRQRLKEQYSSGPGNGDIVRGDVGGSGEVHGDGDKVSFSPISVAGND